MKLLVVAVVVAARMTSPSPVAGPACNEMTDVTCPAAAAPCTLSQAQDDRALCPALVQVCGDTTTVFEPDAAWSYVYGSDGTLISVAGQPTPACAAGPAHVQPSSCTSAAVPTTVCATRP